VGNPKAIVLAVFRLLTTHDLRRLTEALTGARRANRVVGAAELLVWEDEVVIPDEKIEAKVLEFPKPQAAAPKETGATSTLSQMGVLSAEEQRARQKAVQEALDQEKPSETDFIIEERERFKESEEKIFKQSGFAEYQRSSNLSLYRVTVTDDKGKEKTRLTSTQGVLVNKKQA